MSAEYPLDLETPVIRYSSFWPIVTVTITLLIILVWQITLVSQQGKILSTQFEQRVAIVEQARNTQAELEKLVIDLIALAKTNNDAKTIVEKYKITQRQPETPAP